MSGFNNETMYAKNVNFTQAAGSAGIVPTVTQDGQLLIGSSVEPNIQVGNLTSTGGTLTITNGSGNINIEAHTSIPITFTEDSGTAQASSNILNVVGNGAQGVVTSGAGNTITVSVFNATTAQKGVAKFNSSDFSVSGGEVSLLNPGGMAWTVVTGATDLVAFNGYFANNAGGVAFTLPTTAAVGDTFEVCAVNAGGWTVAQNAGQTIYVGNTNTTAGVGGSLASTAIGDWIKLVCYVADTDFYCHVQQGNVTVT